MLLIDIAFCYKYSVRYPPSYKHIYDQTRICFAPVSVYDFYLFYVCHIHQTRCYKQHKYCQSDRAMIPGLLQTRQML